MKRSTLFKLLLALAIIIVAFIVYKALFVGGDGGGVEPGLETVGLDSTETGSDEFLNILLSLQQIELSSEVFSNPIFTSLVDFSTELKDQTPGRENPFAPIGIGGRPATSTEDF